MMLKRNNGKLLLSIWLLALLIASAHAQTANEALRAELVSSIDFVPEILEMIRRHISSKLSRRISLIFHPVDRELQEVIEPRTSILLLEQGFSDSLIKEKYHDSGMHIRLAWVLVGKKEFFAEFKGKDYNLETFSNVLQHKKAQSPDTFPWFESLCSKNTLLNFSRIFPVSQGKLTPRPFYEQRGLIKILYRAMEEGLLNPLSVEADQLLATKVFVANDSFCFTCWVPLDYLLDEKLVHQAFGDAEVRPFPNQSGTAEIPVLNLQIWVRNDIEQQIASDTLELDFSNLVVLNRDFVSDREWMQKQFPAIYDMLIMGEFQQ